VVRRVAARAVSWHFGFGLFITLACKSMSLVFSEKVYQFFLNNDNKEEKKQRKRNIPKFN